MRFLCLTMLIVLWVGLFNLLGEEKINQDEKLTLTINSSQLGVHPLGDGHPSSATFEDAGGNLYTRAPLEDGRIEITYRCMSCGWLTGTFRFTGINPGIDTINVQKGFFFEASFLDGNIDTGGPNAGTLTADVNEDPFNASIVTADRVSGSIIISGFLDNRIITIKVPENSVGGNYILPITGFSASYTNNDETTEAISGIITVNYNNTDARKMLIFFNFDTGTDLITVGRTRVDY